MTSSISRRCGILALVAILAIGNAAGIQAIAWLGMIITRAQTVTLSEAVASTLSGARPCALCKIAKALATAEESASPGKAPSKAPLKMHLTPAMKWILDEPWMMPVAASGTRTTSWPALNQFAASYCSSPPTPPPRS